MALKHYSSRLEGSSFFTKLRSQKAVISNSIPGGSSSVDWVLIAHRPSPLTKTSKEYLALFVILGEAAKFDSTKRVHKLESPPWAKMARVALDDLDWQKRFVVLDHLDS